MSRRTPWGANIARAVSGDPYVDMPEGTATGDSCSQALVKAGLDWDVGLKEIAIAGGPKIDRYHAVVRESDDYALGVVGRAYTPIQNTELAMFTDSLSEEATVSTTAVGSLDEGRRVFAVVDFGDYRPPGMGGTEVIDLSMVVHSRHDGGGALTAGLFPLRLSCANGMRHTIGALARNVKIRHTLRADVRLDEARRALGIAEKAITAMSETVERLIETPLTDAKFAKLMEQLLPIKGDEVPASTITRRTNTRDAMFALWSEAPNLDQIRGTGYAAVNAVAEWEQWVRPVRGERSREDAHMMALTGSGSSMAERAQAAVLS